MTEQDSPQPVEQEASFPTLVKILDQHNLFVGDAAHPTLHAMLVDLLEKPIRPAHGEAAYDVTRYFSLSRVWNYLQIMETSRYPMGILHSTDEVDVLEVITRIQTLRPQLPRYQQLILDWLAHQSGFGETDSDTTPVDVYTYYGGTHTGGCSKAEPSFAQLMTDLESGSNLFRTAGVLVVNGSGLVETAGVVIANESGPVVFVKDAPLYGDTQVGINLRPVTVRHRRYPAGFIFQCAYDVNEVRSSTYGGGILQSDMICMAAIRPSTLLFDDLHERRQAFGNIHESTFQRYDTLSLDSVRILAQRMYDGSPLT